MAPDPRIRGRIEREMRSKLLRGEFVAGESLPIGALAKEWHVSETPVREAAWRAVGAGWLTVDPAGGFRIWNPDVDELRDFYDGIAVLLADAITLCDPADMQLAASESEAGPVDDEDAATGLLVALARRAPNALLRRLAKQCLDRIGSFRCLERELGVDWRVEALNIAQAFRTGSRATAREQVRRFCRRRNTLAPAVLGLSAEHRRLRKHSPIR